jgi:hypothetical protein
VTIILGGNDEAKGAEQIKQNLHDSEEDVVS